MWLRGGAAVEHHHRALDSTIGAHDHGGTGGLDDWARGLDDWARGLDDWARGLDDWARGLDEGARAASTTGPAASTKAPAGCVAPPVRWSPTQLANELLMVVGSYTQLAQLSPGAAAGVGGFVFLGEPPVNTGPAVRAGILGLDGAAAGAGRPYPWMSTDTEGGPVSRLANVLGAIPSARQMAEQWTTAQVVAEMAARGAAMRNLGITMDLGPVLDTASPTDPVADESQRSFSATPHVVASYGSAFAAGMRQAGVVAVGKHFPGLGHASANTDTGPSTDPPLSSLEAVDLIPFAQAVAAGLPVVMVGHPVVPGLTGNLPASLSGATYSLLRSTLHFAGVTMTDSLAAGAISAAGYGEAGAAVAAVEAGADMPMIDASTWQPVLSALEAAMSSGALPGARVDASVTRILDAKRVTLCS